jgi:hypothetical protein
MGKAKEIAELGDKITVSASGTTITGGVTSTNIPEVDLAIAPEVLEIQIDAPGAGQNPHWLWTWEQSTLPYARRTITNSPEVSVPLYKQGTYVINNFAKSIHASMTQTHTLYFKWIDGAGTENLVSWVTDSGTVSDSHPDIDGGNTLTVQRLNISVPATITLPTLTAPTTVEYDITNSGTGAYSFSGDAAGDNPNIGPLYRGGTYTVNITATGHPFYFTTDNGTNFASGTYFGEYTNGVTGSRTDNGTITFTVPNNAPDTLYYQCGNHSPMRGAITIKDLAVETNNNGNYIVYAQHTQEGHKTPIEIRPIPSLVNQMCIVYDASVNKFVPQDLATYVENTPSFENKIREVAGTATLVDSSGNAVVPRVNIYNDSTYLPLVGNEAGDMAFATDIDAFYVWDGSAWEISRHRTSDTLTEGSTNLYYTDVRVDARLASGSVGDLVVGGNLIVNGTTTTINSTSLSIDDLNITLASGAADNAAADGAGITVDGSNANLTYISSGDTWTMNKELRLQNNKGIFFRDSSASGSLGIKSDTSNNITFRTGGFWDRLVIADNGNVGINTSNPSGRLHIQTNHTSTDITAANSNETLVLGNSGVGNGVYNALRFGGNQQDMYIMSFNNNQQSDRRLGFFLGSVAGDATDDERLTVRGNGNIGVNNTTPPAKLSVGKTTNNYEDSIAITGINSQNDIMAGIGFDQTIDTLIIRNDQSFPQGGIAFRPANGTDTKMFIRQDGNVGISTTNPQSTLDSAGIIRQTREIVSNSVYKSFTIGSNRQTNDYGGLNKEYWAIQLQTPGPSTTGESSQHAYGSLKFSGVSDSDTTLDDVLVLKHNGYVGIGTNNPQAKLHINGSDENIRLQNTGTSNYGLEIWRGANKGASIAWGEGNANLEIKNYRNDSQSTGPYANIDFYTGGTNATSPNYNPDLRMRIQQTGEVGIGTSNPTSLLHIHGDGTTLRLDGSANTTRRIFFRSTSTSNPAEIYADGTLKLWTEDANTSILLAPENNSNYTIEHNANGFAPAQDNQLDLGRYDKGWKNVYTNDLQLSNMNSEDGNEVDGTKGKWTIQEGEEELFIINRLTGKKYAFMLREIE